MARRNLSDSTVERALTGERAAVEGLVQAFLPRVYGLCLRMTKSRELADEASQEAFVRVLKSLPKLRDPARLDSWVLTIAANTARKLLAKRGRDRPLDHEPQAIVATQDDHAEAKSKAIDLAVNGLKSEERELFLLHTVEGFRLKQLAKDNDTTVSAMKARVHRIRTKVRVGALAELEKAGCA